MSLAKGCCVSFSNDAPTGWESRGKAIYTHATKQRSPPTELLFA